jgi:hypothetical protein
LIHVPVAPGDLLPVPIRQAKRLAPPGTSVEHVYLRVDGALDVPSLISALRAVVARHDVLHAGVVVVDGEPHLRIPAEVVVEFAVERVAAVPTVGDLTPDGDEGEWGAAFDPDGPLLRVAYLVSPSSGGVLVLAFDSIAFDGWALQMFFSELSAAYGAACGGREWQPTREIRQLGDYAVWQRSVLTGESRQRLVDYWRETLRGRVDALMLAHDDVTERARPVGQPRPLPAHLASGNTIVMTLSEGQAEAFARVGGAARATPHIVFLAALISRLRALTGKKSLTLLGPFACRSMPGAESIIGNLLNVLPIRVDVEDSQQRFLDLVRATRSAVLSAIAHEHLPYADLNEAVVNEALPDHRQVFVGPLTPASFVLGDVPVSRMLQPEVALYDISFFVGIEHRALRIVHRKVLFDAAWIRQLATEVFSVVEREAATLPR